MSSLTKDRQIKRLLDEPVVDEDSIIFTVRMRIARNLENYVFPHHMSEKDAESLVNEVIEALKGFHKVPFIIPMVETDALVREFFVERHIISPEFAENGFGKVLILFPETGLRVLVNEEDHLRICICGKKEKLERMWNTLNRFDDILSEKLHYAFDSEFGYLTSCPTNVGPALRASALLFLPSLKLTKKIKDIFDMIIKLGYVVRGFYGEGSSSIGDCYQIATGPALGKKEKDIYREISSLIDAVRQQELLSMEGIDVSYIRDKIKMFLDRIYEDDSGINSCQALKGISLLLFGKNLGIIEGEIKLLKKLVYRVLPASIQIEADSVLVPEERDIFRLQLLRQQLRSIYV